jgi:uncharacterized protein (TIGR03067 family)
MRLKTTLVALAAGLLLAANGPDDAAKKEMASFQGTWVITAAEKDGQPLGADQLADYKLTIEGDKRTSKKGDEVVSQSTYKLDPKQNPKAIDIAITEGPLKDKVLPGIYEIDGDTQKICIALIGRDRPKNFSTEAGNGHLLQVFKREKR